MNDRELLERAAKAAGIEYEWHPGCGDALHLTAPDATAIYWNPLIDDGDALRLAMKLDLLLMPYPLDNAVRVTRLDQPDTIVSFGTPPDPYAATRRAIVRAAAELGGQS